MQTQIESDKFGLNFTQTLSDPKIVALLLNLTESAIINDPKLVRWEKPPFFFSQFCFVFIFLGNLNQCDCVYIKVDTLILAWICAFLSFSRSGFCSVDCNNWKSSSFFFFFGLNLRFLAFGLLRIMEKERKIWIFLSKNWCGVLFFLCFLV